jgi:hypothetical protein
VEYTFFGVQAAVKDMALRSELHAIVARAPASMSLIDKREYYTAISNMLLPRAASFDFGYWDYIADPHEAESEFDSWVSEIEKTVADGADGPPPEGVYRRSAGDYFLFTLAFLLEKGGSSDATIADRCDLAEGDFFTRQTFATLVATPPMLGYASVRADAFYVVPGADDRALTAELLRGEGYEYLRELR